MSMTLVIDGKADLLRTIVIATETTVMQCYNGGFIAKKQCARSLDGKLLRGNIGDK